MEALSLLQAVPEGRKGETLQGSSSAEGWYVMRLAHMGNFHPAHQMTRHVIAITQGCASWMNKTTLHFSDSRKSSKMSASDHSAETFTPDEAASLLAALIRIALINGEITEDNERRLAVQCRQELLKVRATTDLMSKQAIVNMLSELIMRLTLRTHDTVLQTLSPRRMAGLRAVLLAEG